MDIAASLIKLFFGSKADKDRKEVEPYLVKIKAVYPTIEALSNDELRARSSNLKKQIADFIAADEARIVELKARLELPDTSLSDKEKISKEIDETVKRIDEKIEQKLDELLPEAFAIMKDTARRFAQNETVEVTANDFDRELAATKDFVKIEGDKAIYATHWLAGGNDVRWDMIHYDVQLFGGVVLHKGKIAEMATGEGKTLVATLPVFLNALAGKGVHMVTVNDYLARRDSEWMGPMYQFHGLTVDCIDRHQPNSDARRKAYMADITFGTNNEYGFDYLRDNMASSPKDLVQRKHHYAIVDEVDSVLIDDARTPLIISGPVPKGDDQLFEQYRPAIEHLYNLQKNLVTNLLAESRQLLGEGKNEEGGIKLYRSHKGLPKYKPLIKFLSEQGIKAQMQKTENIYMQDNNRRMPEITDDLYFVIDEKMNSVELTDKGHEALSKYFNEEGFFVLPDIGARIAEIEKEEITPEEKAQKRDAVINDYAVKAERVQQLGLFPQMILPGQRVHDRRARLECAVDVLRQRTKPCQRVQICAQILLRALHAVSFGDVAVERVVLRRQRGGRALRDSLADLPGFEQYIVDALRSQLCRAQHARHAAADHQIDAVHQPTAVIEPGDAGENKGQHEGPGELKQQRRDGVTHQQRLADQQPNADDQQAVAQPHR